MQNIMDIQLAFKQAQYKVSKITVILHRESKKTRHLTLAHSFTKYWPIFKILSALDSVGNLQQSYIQIPHHTLNVSLHYLVTYLCSKNRHS